MEAKHLRIGNYVMWVDDLFKVEIIDSYCATNKDPIPLTEEWLFKFGFTNYEWCTDCAFIKFNYNHIMLRYYNNKWHCTKVKVTKDNDGHKMSNGKDIVKKGLIKHVHELQNLYYALTGVELTIKDI